MLPFLASVAAPMASKVIGDVASKGVDSAASKVANSGDGHSIGKDIAGTGIKSAGGQMVNALPKMQQDPHEMMSKLANGMLGHAGSKAGGLM